MEGFVRHALGDAHELFVGELPPQLRPDQATFERWWALHPPEFHQLMLLGRTVSTPRWQQAYGADYQYTGSVNRARTVPDEIKPLHAWAREAIHSRLNGLLLNWYDASLEHYIGKHRDNTTNMVEGAPIVTISFGSERVFRLRPWRGKEVFDFAARDGTVFVMPYATNNAWTHEVPHSAKSRGRRISVTLRSFLKS